MAIRSGLAAQVGWSKETTFGTSVAPATFVPHLDGTAVEDASTWEVSDAIIAGGRFNLASTNVRTAYMGQGTLSTSLWNKSLGKVFEALMGTTVTPVLQNTSTGYLQTHTFGDPFGKSLTFQVGVPDTTGTVRPHNLLGAKVTGCEIACSAGGLATVNFDLWGQQFSEATALAAASYPSSLKPYNWSQLTIKAGATAAGATSVSGVRSFSVRINQGQDGNRDYAGSAGLHAEPIINTKDGVISGSLSVDYLDKTVFADRFHAGTTFALVFEFVGASLGGSPTIFETFRITIDSVRLTSGTPGPNGTDLTNTSFDFEALYDGTNMPKIEIISTDTTV